MNTLNATYTPSRIIVDGNEINAENIPWSPHASFKGVALKHLLKGESNGGLASFHLVKVEPGCALLQHTHPGKWELHEVVGGEGTAVLNGQSVHYQPGCMALIPADAPHEVVAGEQGLLILAKFFPALI